MNKIPVSHGDILVIEDSKSDLKLLSEILRKASYRVRPVSDGELALQSVQTRLPDLILLDINMPGMNGIEVCRRFKADPGTRDIPVIFISAYGEIDMKLKALEAGGVDYITKPLEASEVLARINVHLNMYRLQRNLVIQSERVNAEIEDRKRAEDALKRSEEKYRLLAENSLDVIWQMDLKLVFTYVSPSIKSIMGYTVDEWVGTRLSKYASTKEFFYMARKALYAIKHYKESKRLTFNVVMLRKDGTEFPVEITTKLLFNKKGLPIGLQGASHDITKYKKAEAELAKHREHLEELVQERTKELEEKNKELKHFNDLFVGREFRIKELRDKVKELEEEAGSRKQKK